MLYLIWSVSYVNSRITAWLTKTTFPPTKHHKKAKQVGFCGA